MIDSCGRVDECSYACGVKCLMTGVLAALVMPGFSLRAAEQVVTLGDSLTFAYEASFGFQVTVQFQGTFGDNMGPEVKNWVEILHDPGYRNAFFDQGVRDGINLTTSLFPPASTNLFFRREYNWAVPGFKIDQLRRFINEEATVTDLLGESPEFGQLQTALNFSDFSNDDFAVSDLEDQIENTAERLVLFIGGNDINGVYGTIYEGGSAGTFVADFIDDATFIIDWVQGLNPNIEIVLANVPHVGITPDVKADYPTDPVKTERVTAVLRDLNGQLEALAVTKNIGYADVFQGTLSLLGNGPLCIHGVPFVNSGSATGDLDFVWLNGPLSANFHPNTNAQTLIANEIIHAFNRRYSIGVAPLSATEMLGDLLGKTSAEIDMPFSTWIGCYGLLGADVFDDTDGDGLDAGLEFALGLNPTVHDSEFVMESVVDQSGTPAIELSYPIRLPVSARYTLVPEISTTLNGFTPLSPVPAVGADGSARASLPMNGSGGFIRLESVITP